MRVRVLGECALVRSLANFARAFLRERGELRGDFLATVGDEQLRARLEKFLDPGPRIGDETSGGAGGLEDARRRREAVAGHALAADVQDRARRAVEGVVIGGVD